MNRDCEIVRDLIPLYAEEMCSQSSAEFVREHTEKCPDCQAVLDEIKKPVPVMADTKTETLHTLRRRLRKKTVFSVLSAVLIILSILAGLVIYATVPVWLSVEEAVVYAEQQPDGSVKVKLSDKVCHISNFENNRFCCQGMRIDWILKASRSHNPNSTEHTISFKPDNEQSLWYYGKFTGESDTLLWGKDTTVLENSYYRQMDRSLLYIISISAFVGIALLICGAVLRKKRLGKWILLIATLFICCALSTLFVTDGHFYDTIIRNAAMLRFSMLARRYAAIAGLTLLSFPTVICTGYTVYLYRDNS